MSRASVAPSANTNFDDYLAPSAAAPIASQEYYHDPTPAARVSNSAVAPGQKKHKKKDERGGKFIQY